MSPARTMMLQTDARPNVTDVFVSRGGCQTLPAMAVKLVIEHQPVRVDAWLTVAEARRIAEALLLQADAWDTEFAVGEAA